MAIAGIQYVYGNRRAGQGGPWNIYHCAEGWFTLSGGKEQKLDDKHTGMLTVDLSHVSYTPGLAFLEKKNTCNTSR